MVSSFTHILMYVERLEIKFSLPTLGYTKNIVVVHAVIKQVHYIKKLLIYLLQYKKETTKINYISLLVQAKALL